MTSSPLGSLPCFLSLQFTIMQSRAVGIAYHILPLGELFLPLSKRISLECGVIFRNEKDDLRNQPISTPFCDLMAT